MLRNKTAITTAQAIFVIIVIIAALVGAWYYLALQRPTPSEIIEKPVVGEAKYFYEKYRDTGVPYHAWGTTIYLPKMPGVKLRVFMMELEEQPYLFEMANKFKELTGIEIEWVLGTPADWVSRGVEAIRSEEYMFDIVYNLPPQMYPFAMAGYFLNLTDLLPKSILMKYWHPGIFQMAFQNETTCYLWFSPGADIHAFFYRKDLFEEYGIPYPPKTWAEVIEAAKKLTLDTDGDGEIDIYGFGMPAAEIAWLFQSELIQSIIQNGWDGYYACPRDGEGHFITNTTECYLALKFIYDLWNTWSVAPGINGLMPEFMKTYGFFDVTRDFAEGRLAMAYIWLGMAKEIDDPAISKVVGKWDVTEPPALLPDHPWRTTQSCCWSVQIPSVIPPDHVDAAKAFLLFITAPEVGKEIGLRGYSYESVFYHAWANTDNARSQLEEKYPWVKNLYGLIERTYGMKWTKEEWEIIEYHLGGPALWDIINGAPIKDCLSRSAQEYYDVGAPVLIPDITLDELRNELKNYYEQAGLEWSDAGLGW